MRAPGETSHSLQSEDVARPAGSAAGAFVVERPVVGPWLQLGQTGPFEWNVARLPVAGLHPELEGLRIVHVTDIHIRKHWRPEYGELVERIRNAPPDLLLVTGDFVDSKRNHLRALPHLYRMLEGFTARLGCYGVLGNHDTLKLGPRLTGTNVRLLCGERELLQVGGGTVELIGLPGEVRKDLPRNFAQTMPPREASPPGTVRIVLSHFPDHLRRTAALRPDLFLAGHTHGGQVCLPGMIPVLRHDSLPRRLCTGVHRVDGTWLVVGRGLGTTTLPIRVFCPPEIIEIRLIPEVLSAE
jgi:uncharacterized protein